MRNIGIDDTIVAISTPVGEGGIGIVRLSGPDALVIAGKVFRPKGPVGPAQFPTYTTHYGHICDNDEVIDEVILTVMRAPKSYTKEDVVEINCHGGLVALKKVLALLLQEGACMAEPGEFTKRAFLNGRIDLAQAEAVLDVIKAKTDASLRVAVNQLEGRLSSEVAGLWDRLISLQGHIEASVDFPEDDCEILVTAEIEIKLKEITGEIDRLLSTAEDGIILRDGLLAVICGKPNVGKSSIMNRLLRQDRSIVTDLPGTTRDVIEEYLNVDGLPLRIADTAGLAEARDLIEEEGIRRSHIYTRRADLVLLVLDGSADITPEDESIMGLVKKRPSLIVINKRDLPKKLKIEKINQIIGKNGSLCEVSAQTGEGIEGLRRAIREKVWSGEVVSSDNIMVDNIRHQNCLKIARDRLISAVSSIKGGVSPELIAADIKSGLDSLGEIIGRKVTDEVLDNIFSNFCIGK
ncbi:MAG: tRNA uridine-5-carboxymethylaminomethyl(34) synthesis GTPase MnmE [Candidatus Omnitrophica bacterium]|nr:tRNA uridine-5-carboxymethylaminomethyl(34) synthesis GTPase MnmE [Candidatus Omnitrophota bacterium]